jgi:hypothetical protein
VALIRTDVSQGDFWYSFLLGTLSLWAVLRVEGLGKLEQLNDLIQNHTRYLPAFSIAPQPTVLPRALIIIILIFRILRNEDASFDTW